MVADMAASTGDTLDWDMEAPGGSGFLEHGGVLGPQTAKIKIAVGGWDYVTLQDQSLRPAVPDTNIYIMFKYGARLDSHINLDNPCAETVFYMTWGRKNGDSSLCTKYTAQFNWPHYCAYSAMDSMIRLRYEQIADSNDAAIAPAGAIWRYLRTHHPAIELYNPDESHPSVAGSYAVACAFYTAFFRKDPSLLTYKNNLDSTNAAIIRAAAKKVVYDSMNYWHIGEHKTNSLFNYSINGPDVTFSNQSTNATSYIWDFGDGQTDTATTPTHTYAQKGIYTVIQVAKGSSGCSDTSYARFNLFPASVDNNVATKASFTVTPNPGNGVFHLEHLPVGSDITVYSTTGQKIYRGVTSGARHTLDLSNAPQGLYMIHATVKGKVYTEKVLIQ